MTTFDSRLGKPSASGIGRVAACPASFKLELVAAEKYRDESPDADAGNEVHALNAGEISDVDASTFAARTSEMCETQCDEVAAEWAASLGIEPPEPSREVRLGLTALNTVLPVTEETAARAAFVFTGQYDLAYVSGSHGLVIDTKALFGEHAQALDNPQLLALAVLVAKRHKLTNVRVALVQPWKGKPTVADYDTNTLRLAEDWIGNALLKEAQATPDDRKAGLHCHHCKARFGCTTFKKPVLQELERIQPMSIAGLPPAEQTKAMWARALELTPEQHKAAYRGLRMIGRYVHAIEGTFKQRVERGEIPGFEIQIKPGAREITDAQAAFSALAPLGVTEQDMLAAASVAIGPLEEVVRKASGLKEEGRGKYNLTTKQAKDALNAALEAAGAIGRKAEKKTVIETANQLEEQE